MPERITGRIRAKAIKKNRFFLKVTSRFYKRDFNLTDPLFEKHFANIELFDGFMDYFKVHS